MGDRKAPRSAPTNQRRPDPPPAQPRMRGPVVTVRITGACDLFASFPMQCPLCGVTVPANTPHSYKRLEKK